MDNKSKKQQKYQKQWNKNPKFKSWILPDPDSEYHVICKFCNKKLKAKCSTLNNHSNSSRHRKNVILINTNENERIFDFEQSDKESNNTLEILMAKNNLLQSELENTKKRLQENLAKQQTKDVAEVILLIK